MESTGLHLSLNFLVTGLDAMSLALCVDRGNPLGASLYIYFIHILAVSSTMSVRVDSSGIIYIQELIIDAPTPTSINQHHGGR